MIVAAASEHVVVTSLTHAVSHVEDIPEMTPTVAPGAAVPAASSDPTVTELPGAAAVRLMPSMPSMPVDIVAARAAHIRPRASPTTAQRARWDQRVALAGAGTDTSRECTRVPPPTSCRTPAQRGLPGCACEQAKATLPDRVTAGP